MAEPRRLIAIAHRAGNHINLLRKAQEIGSDYVEADVRLYRNRLEVRHLKTMRWLPLLYDRHPWRLAPGWTRRLVFRELLSAVGPDVGLMIDLKGENDQLPGAIVDAVRTMASTRNLIACGQNWRLVDSFVADDGVRAMHSIGRASQLDAFLRGDRRTEGISIHASLLTPDVVSRLHERAPMVVTWPINTRQTLRRVADCGVDGITTDSFEILRAVVAGEPYSNAGLAATAPPGSDPARNP
jgi:glycerophosphoryl diester phosphodiesterase